MSVASSAPPEIADLPWIDLFSPEWTADPWGVVRRLRETDPWGGRLARSRRGVEVLGYADYERLTTDARLTSVHVDLPGAGPMTTDFMDNGHLLTFAPDRHRVVRRVMVAAFSRRRVEEHQEWYAQLAEELCAAWLARDRCDLVRDFSHRYSIEILCRLIGVPRADIPVFEDATLRMAAINANPFEPGAADLELALERMYRYSTEIVTKIGRAPSDDFLGRLVAAQRATPSLTEPELIWSVANLLFAGHDTTRYQLAAVVHAVVRAGVWDVLAEQPELIPTAVSEGMRLQPVVQLTTRRVAADGVVVGDVPLPQGTVVRFNWFGINRDPTRFPRPDELELDRDAAEVEGRVAFGKGVHTCIGRALARADLEAGLATLTRLVTDVRVDGDVPVQPYTGGMGGPTALPITFRPRP